MKSWDTLAREMVREEIKDGIIDNWVDFEIAVMLKAAWLKEWGTHKRRSQHWP